MMMLNLLQRPGGGFGPAPGGGAAGAPDATFALILNGIQCFVGIIGLVLLIMMIVTWKNTLEAVSPRNREMSPGQAWLNLIPCFNLVWMFLTVFKVAESLRKEFKYRGLRGDGDFGKSMGLAYIILTILCGPIGWIFLFIYRGKLNGYVAELQRAGRRAKRDDSYEDEEEDFEDDEPEVDNRRRRRQDDDDRDDDYDDRDEEDRPRRRR